MELLETIAQSHEIEKIIQTSEEFMIIVSPYLKINRRLKPKFTECFNKNKKNLILYRENELSKLEQDWLTKFDNVTLFPIKNLHAKCYMNENSALITSMNLYEYSQINNHEIGIKISNGNNRPEFEKLLKIVEMIVQTDHSYFDFSDYNVVDQDYSMGSLYAELVNKYEFPDRLNGSDGIYRYMSKIATGIYDFSSDSLKFDKQALKRSTLLDRQKYYYLKKELIKKGLKK